jgi:hypothetical protein
MRLERSFQPFTIYVETKEEARILEDALETLVKTVQNKGGSWWAGWRDKPLTGEQQYYRAQINKLRFLINPDLKNRPLFMADWT